MPVKQSKVFKQRRFLCVDGGGWKHRCPVSEGPIKQHTGPAGRKLLLTGRHQEKRTSQSTHIFNTHTHTAVDKIYQVSGTTPREGVDLWNTQLIKSSFSMTHTSGCGFKRIPACVL